MIDFPERLYTSNGWLPIGGGMDAMTDAHSPEPVTPDTVRLRRPIGQIFVEFGFITAAQLDAALEVQRTTGARIGEILVEQGSLGRLDLASALAEHWEPRNQEQEPVAAETPLLHRVAPASQEERTSGAGGEAAIAALELRLRAAEDLLARRLEQQASVPRPEGEMDSAQQERVDDLALRLAALDGIEGTIEELRRSIEALAAVRESDALAAGARLAGAEAAIAVLDGLETRIRDGFDLDESDRLEALAARLALSETRLDGLVGIEERVSELAGFATEFRGELEALAGRPVVGDPGERLLELSAELDRTARDTRETVATLADELRAEAAARAADVGVGLHAESDEAIALRARVEELEVEAARARTDAERAAAAWRNEVGSLAARIDELLGLRHADAQAARAAREQLGERLDELAMLSPNDAGASPDPEAGLELQAKLERVASSVEQLGRRLDEQVAIGEEQARATERAVRKGLASLGKQLTGQEAKVSAGGKGLGRSLERLGAAVVEADARLAEEVSVLDAVGYVAFAPTPTGYRLVEAPGPPPELGATVEVEGCESPLVVTRFGRSPLPFDRRPCAYLDRV